MIEDMKPIFGRVIEMIDAHHLEAENQRLLSELQAEKEAASERMERHQYTERLLLEQRDALAGEVQRLYRERKTLREAVLREAAEVVRNKAEQLRGRNFGMSAVYALVIANEIEARIPPVADWGNDGPISD